MGSNCNRLTHGELGLVRAGEGVWEAKAVPSAPGGREKRLEGSGLSSESDSRYRGGILTMGTPYSVAGEARERASSFVTLSVETNCSVLSKWNEDS